jgi:RimJ/RimL family protein N-acetyltransferase
LEPPDPPLTDGPIRLRPPDERDIDAIDRGITDPDVIRWIGPATMSARGVLELNRSRWLDGSGPTFAICGADDRCIGHVWLNQHGGDRWTVGYWLLPEARGQGLATRAVGLVSAWAFRDLGLTELSLVTDGRNPRSQRVAERSNFKREGAARPGVDAEGRPVELLDYRLSRKEAVGRRRGRDTQPGA